jgi:uncharacterized coiled-coil DUF342 family protein
MSSKKPKSLSAVQPDISQFLNQKYLELCQQLGDAQIKLDQLNEHVATIKQQIKNLNEAHPLMFQYQNISDKQKDS